jgi:FG-GAP repeat
MTSLTAFVAFATLPLAAMLAVLGDKWTKPLGRIATFILIYLLVLPGAATAQVSASPSQLPFGSVSLGGASAAHSVRLTNSGSVTVYPSYPAITGASASDFQVLSTDCPLFNAALLQIEASASCNFSFQFVPTIAGPETATATFPIYDSSFQPISTAVVGLSGTATLPFTVSPAQLNFGYSIENSNSVSLPLTVTNSGSLPLDLIASVTNPDFSVDLSPCHHGPVAVGASCAINVLFTPTITGTDSGVLVLIAVNGVGQPLAQVSVPLAGIGHPLEVTFTAFGLQLPGGIYQSPVGVFNHSSAPVNINTLLLSGSGFARDNGCIGTLAPRSSCVVTITFTPTANAAYSGTLTIFDDDATSPQVVPLSGAGSSAVVSTRSLGYPIQTVGVSSSQTVTLTNAYTTPLAVGGIRASGDFSEKDDCGRWLGPNSSCNITVAFSPTDVGPREGTLVLNEKDPSSPQSVTLSGYGVAPIKHVYVHYDYMVLPDQGTACTPRNSFPGDRYSPDCAQFQGCIDSVCRGHSHAPDQRAIDTIIEAFRQHGSELHIDPHHTAIPEQATIEFGPRGFECPNAVDPVNFYDLRDQYYQPGHKFEHYTIFGHLAQGTEQRDCNFPSGVGELPPFETGQNFVVSLGNFLDVGFSPDTILRWEAGTFMHELGHNLGLQHGGGLFGFGDETNYKPNYLSVMNYSNQTGIQQTDAVGSEQGKACYRDKDCGPAALCTGINHKFCTRYDYSDQLLPTGGPTPGVLDELGQLSEPAGLGSGRPNLFFYSDGNCLQQVAPSDGPVDWNGDGDTTGTGLTVDLDFRWWSIVLSIGTCPSGVYVPLKGHDDWADLSALQERPLTVHSWKSSQRPERHELTLDEAKARHILHPPRPVTVLAPSACSSSALAARPSTITLHLLGADDLDVSEIDISSLKLHGVAPETVSVVDVDGDGRPDLVLTFPTAFMKLHPNAKRVTLTGFLKNSQSFWGHAGIGCQ